MNAVSVLAGVPLALAVAVLSVAVAHALVTRGRGREDLVGAFRLALEFLLAATLIRLASGDELRALALAAALVVLRQLLGLAAAFVLRVPSAPGR